MGSDEPGGGKERELRHKSEPSLRGGGRGDNLISCVRLSEERNKQDKTGLLIPNLYWFGINILVLVWYMAQNWHTDLLGSRRHEMVYASHRQTTSLTLTRHTEAKLNL